MPDLSGPEPVDDALADLARRRRDRWFVAGLVLLALGGVVVLLVAADVARGPVGLGAVALVGVAVVYGIAVGREERHDRRLVTALVAERERTAARRARIAALESLEAAEREVLAAHDLPEVFERLVAAACSLGEATAGMVLLRSPGGLTVAASTGAGAPERGVALPFEGNVAGAAFTREEALLGGRGSPWGGGRGDSTIAAPLRLPDRRVGVLVLERDADAPAFGELDLAVISSFAQHAALALRNARLLDAEREAVAASDEAARGLLATVAALVHDLRTPLTAASGFLQLLVEREAQFTSERRASLLADVRAELGVLRELVEELDDVAASAAPGRAFAGKVDLAELARRFARTSRGLAHARRDPRRVTIDAPGPAPVTGDERSLGRVVANLVDNAIRHTPAGSPVEVAVTVRAGEAVLVVRDHGTGGAGTATAVREALSTPRPGRGLDVVRRLVASLGGRVIVEAAPDGGLRLEVAFPFAG